MPGADGFPTDFFKLFVLRPRPGYDTGGEPVGGTGEQEDEDAQFARAHRMIDLLVAVYADCDVRGAFPPAWNTSVTSLLFKAGAHDILANYRPISVCPTVYKIFARCLADGLQTALPWLVDATQVACQEGKSCFTNTRYIQDLIHYCNTENRSGVLLFCDATKAFDRVQHGYLLRTMAAMRIPATFQRLYSLLLAGATTRVKVNGYLGAPISLRNGVRQGDPIAPLAFLLSLQPFLSMLHRSQSVGVSVPLADGSSRHCRLRGIEIPSADGSSTVCYPAAAMADDVAVALYDTHQFPVVKLIMDTHERASGGLNNWLKTFGLRLGPLAGSTALPLGWDPNWVTFSSDPVRYLGIYLGCDERVARKWCACLYDEIVRADSRDLTSRIERRFEEWAALGVGASYTGRNLVVKNSVLAMAWYMVESQAIDDLDDILSHWQRAAWRFVEASRDALCHGPPSRSSAHRVARLVLSQDYAEGGRRCLDIECFARALRMRSVRALFEPSSHPFQNLPLYWIRLSYAALRIPAQYLLLSNCDFTHLTSRIPLFWRQALQAWGCEGDGIRLALPTAALTPPFLPQPTYQNTRPLPPFDDGVWHRPPTRRAVDTSHLCLSLGACLSLPIAYSPFTSSCLGAPVRGSFSERASSVARDRATQVCLLRGLGPDCTGAAYDLRVRLERAASRGITHLFHLFTGFEVGAVPRRLTVAEISSRGAMRREVLPRWLCEELLASIPPIALQLVDAAASLRSSHPHLTFEQLCASSIPAGSFVCVPGGLVCEVTNSPDLSGQLHLSRCFVMRPDCRLAPPAPGLSCPVTAPRDCTTEVQVWLTTKMAHCEEQRAFEERNHDSVRRVWLCGGQAVDTATLFGRACVSPFTANPSYLSLAYYPTDRVRPPLAVAALDVYQLYHRSLSFRRYIPRTLDPSLPPSDTSTSFSHLLSAESALPPEVRLSICLASHPSVQHGRREAEALYLTVFDARPLGNDRCPKVGPTHAHCDICWLVDGVLRRETT